MSAQVMTVILSYLLINGVYEYEGLGVMGAAWGSLVAVLLRAIFLYLVLN